MSIASNNVIGTLPPELSALRSLQRIDVSGNCMYGAVPSQMFKLLNLTEIDLGWNYLSGVFPSEIYGLKLLTRLNLAGNKNEGNCTHSNGITRNFFSEGLEGHILGWEIRLLSELRELNIYLNSFGDEISPAIGTLQHLGMTSDAILSVEITWFKHLLTK